eukprot:473359-Prymnesium_polylepis.1
MLKRRHAREHLGIHDLAIVQRRCRRIAQLPVASEHICDRLQVGNAQLPWHPTLEARARLSLAILLVNVELLEIGGTHHTCVVRVVLPVEGKLSHQNVEDRRCRIGEDAVQNLSLIHI